MSDDKLRAEFEAAYRDPHGGRALFDRDADGDYVFLEQEFVDFRTGYCSGHRAGMERAKEICEKTWGCELAFAAIQKEIEK